MELIIIHENNNSTINTDNSLLQFGISSEPVVSVISDGLGKNLQLNGDKDVVVAIPERWSVKSCVTLPKINYYDKDIPLSYKHLRVTRRNPWFAISNGRFATRIDRGLIEKVLVSVQADVIAINVEPELLPYHEKVRLTAHGKVAGFRRLYSHCAEPAPTPDDWPHHLFIKTDILNKLLAGNALPLSFTKFINSCFSNSLTVHSLNIGGTVLDLETEKGLLGFLTSGLNSSVKNHHNANNKYRKGILDRDSIEISPSARLFGKVVFGQNVSIGRNAIIVGPTIIGSDVKIAKGTVIRASIVGPGISVPQNSIVQNRVLINGRQLQKQTKRAKTNCMPIITNGSATHQNSCVNNFRTWPRFSYARCLKRIADIVAAVTVLILFAPIVPIIALAVKLASRGPVFFKDTRQGLYGKVFNCIKFRTMLVGSDRFQDKLRTVNETDGPQFKMADDPRTSAVGRFLRDTYIDEIPQFFNVLLGQMSVVGPRPSPESENTLCPSWRDARLSVRPGITGLWQVCRTRQPMRDFQEWIHYDTKYVRDLKLRMDLWICWQTVRKLVKNFVSQF